MDSGFHVVDSSLCPWNLDSEFRSLVGYRIHLAVFRTPKPRIALMHVYVTQANFTTKPRFEIKNKRSFTEMNSQGSRVEKNTHAQKVQMQKILFTNEACW